MGEAQKCVAELDVDEVGATTVQLIWEAFREEDKKREMVQRIAEPPSPFPHSALCMKTKYIFFL